MLFPIAVVHSDFDYFTRAVRRRPYTARRSRELDCRHVAAKVAILPNIHVVSSGNKAKVEVKRGTQAWPTYDSQDAAIVAGTALAKKLPSELIVQGSDGAIRMRNSYGNDPRDVKG
ncbi:DUF2188 domain-containing protein [Cupriavidus sp. SS-3]|uniref:DUF2188 domain-containing protein n=1 Tax=Cupriavidus sp. SS-3 TaxID=3109596 RepID=UPI002DB7B612|nr:DUF2188 domain-containing protein [Cupriavidus sp. SS-3]MEC3767477.1 DUF2188 domain-containing protein [Cupriavidus sp. SS-3]